MDVSIQNIDTDQKEQVLIQCHKVTEEVEDICRFIHSRDEILEVFNGTKILYIPLSDIYYIEAVDNHVFVYLAKDVYELKMKLYEFEERYSKRDFFRCSKQNIINIMKIVDITPALNGRFTAKLSNQESVIISRKYVNELFKKLRGE